MAAVAATLLRTVDLAVMITRIVVLVALKIHTNLRQISLSFTTQNRSPTIYPVVADDRTKVLLPLKQLM